MDNLAEILMQQEPEDDSQKKDLSRQRRIAELLMAKGMQQPQGQMVSGYYIAPSWTQQIAPMVNAAMGIGMDQRLDKKESELAKALRQRNLQEVMTYNELMQGKLAPEQAGPNINAEGQAIPMPQERIGANPQLANLYAAGVARNPVLQQVGMKKLTEGPKWERVEYMDEATGKTKQGVIDVNSRDPLSTLQVGGVKPALSEKEKMDLMFRNKELQLKMEDNALARQKFMFDTGIGVGIGGVGGGGMPTNYQTINPGSPIMTQQQQQNMPQAGMPQTGMPAMPQFRNAAEKDVWIANQKARGELQAKAMDALPNAIATAQNGISAIEGMIGDTTVDTKGNIVKGKQDVHPGFYGAVGMPGISSGFGISGYLPATDVTDFKKRFGQIEGKSFLAAIDSLRGTGQITEIEGAKATAAINRMSLAQSEKEFIIAANELKDIMRKAVETTQTKAGIRPMSLPDSTGGVRPVLRYDPTTKQWN